MFVQLRPSRTVPESRRPSGPPLTVLGVVTDGWTWRPEAENQPDRVPRTDDRASTDVNHQLVRAFLWARLLTS